MKEKREAVIKKKISGIIAFILFLNTALPLLGLGALTVYGATIDYITALDQGLRVGTANPTPLDMYNSVPADQATVKWNFNMYPEGGFYELTYPLADGKRAILNIVKNSSSLATVSYTAQKYNTTSLIWENIESLTSPGALGFSVHTNVGANGNERFLPIGNYLSGGFNPVDPAHRVISFGDDPYNPATQYPPDPNDPAYALLTPKFKIKPGAGFSFRFDNVTVHFKWGENGTFTYSTNRIELGRLYPFELKHKEFVADSYVSAGERIILTGFNTDSIKVTPFANSVLPSTIKTVDNILERVTDPPDDAFPGSADVGMIIEIPIPTAWKEPKFEQDSTTVLPVSLMLGNLEMSKQIQIRIDNINAVLPVATLYSGAATAPTCTLTKDPDKITLTLGNLEPNMIYHASSISLTDNQQNLYAKSTALPFGKFFTFAEYKIEPLGGKYYAVVQPYKGYTGHFMLKSGTGANALEPAMSLASDGIKPLAFPLTISSEFLGPLYYQVFFQDSPFINNDTSKSIYSQKLHYMVIEGEPDIGIPSIFRILNYSMLPADGDFSGKTGTVDISMTWDIGKKSAIDKMVALNNGLVIKYDLKKSLTPDNKTPDDFIKDVTVSIRAETVTNPDGTTQSALKVTYSDPNGKVINTTEVDLETYNDSASGATLYMARVNVRVSAASKDATDLDLSQYDLLYPNIYFINTQPMEVNNQIKALGPSLYDSLTLSDLGNQLVPPPQNLRITDTVTATAGEYGALRDEVSLTLDLNFPATRISEYLEKSYNLPPDKAIVNMDLYICQNETYLRDVFAKFGPTQIKVPADVETIDRIKNSVVVPYKDEYGSELYFSNIAGNTAMAVSNYTDAREALRNNKVVMIRDITASAGGLSILPIKFDGLDKNQKYYIIADISVTHRDSAETFKIRVDSIFSNLAGVTTKGDKEVPKPEEKIPAAPQIDKKDVRLNEATVFWTDPVDPATGETFEYELFRVKSQPIATRFLEDRSLLGVLWPQITAAGAQEPVKILEYTNGQLINHDPTKYLYDPATKSVRDISLSPNQIYFYYIRTVKIVDASGLETRSVWNYTTLTTTTVKSPKNLIVESGRKDYEPMHEVWISFDAPITDLTKLGTELNLQYQLKEEGQDWGEHVTMNPSVLRQYASAAKEEGYMHFLYKITGLKAGTGYTVRVRMTDNNGDASLYTNVAPFRTDLDQEEYDKDKETTDWVEFLKQQIEKLIKDPYWVTKNTDAELEVVYRPTMFDSLLSQSTDGLFTLVQGKQDKAVYYLPASALLSLNNQGKGIRAVRDDMDIILSPNALDPSNNDALLAMADKIKGRSVTDYFVKITLTWTNMRDPVEGNEPLTKQADVAIEAVGTKVSTKELDAEIYRTLAEGIANDTSLTKYREEFRKKIDGMTPNEELVKYVSDLVGSAQNNYMSTVTKMVNQTLDASLAVTALDKPLIVAAKGIDETASVSGYQRESGQWIAKDVVPYASGRAIYANSTGSFIFTGRIIKIPGIENMPGAGQATGIVAKYGLDDFFGKGDEFNLEANATRHMVVSSIARMAGAPKGSDPVAWLRQKGITVPSRNMTADIPTQETVFLVMSLYEVKANTNVSKLRITNFNQTSGVQGMDDRYKQHIRAAFQLGICTNTNMNAKSPVKVKEVLQMLTALDSKVKI